MSPEKLSHKRASKHLAGEGLVYASAESLIRLKQEGGKLPLKAIRVGSRGNGAYLSRFKGRGMEFDEARRYQPGDEIRNIDWRVTARTGQTHTKMFREERERAVILWVDYRAPMFFATRGRFKSVMASQAAAMLAWSARNLGDRLGGLAFSEQGHREIRPRNGDRAALNMIALLARFSHQIGDPSTPEQRREAVTNALTRVRRVTRPGSLVFMISDFRDLGERFETQLSALARHNDLVLLQLFDPLEAHLPKAGWYRVSDGSRFLAIDSGNPALRRAHQQRHRNQLEYLTHICQRLRIHLLSCATDDDLLTILQQGLGRQPR